MRESGHGYKAKFEGPPQSVRSTPDSRHSSWQVRFRTDFVRFTSDSGRSRDHGGTSAPDPMGTSRAAF
jgi:hypothetical protein